MKIFTSHFDYFQDFEIVILYNTNMIKNGSTKFRNRLKELRVGMSLTQSELANKLNIPTSTYANWELGRTEPSITDIFNLIDFLRLKPTIYLI